MITAIISANEDAKAITRTLNALISATVDGLVREVVLIAVDGNQLASDLADHAGCAIVAPDDFASAVHKMKGEWLMVLEAGALPEQGWAEAIGDYIHSSNAAARFTRSPLAPRTFLHRLLFAKQPLALGLLIKKRNAISLGDAALCSPHNLAKAVKPKAMPAALRPA